MREESALGSTVLAAQRYQMFSMPGVVANVENVPGLESMTRFAVHTTSRNFGGANHFVCWTIHRYAECNCSIEDESARHQFLSGKRKW